MHSIRPPHPFLFTESSFFLYTRIKKKPPRRTHMNWIKRDNFQAGVTPDRKDGGHITFFLLMRGQLFLAGGGRVLSTEYTTIYVITTFPQQCYLQPWNIEAVECTSSCSPFSAVLSRQAQYTEMREKRCTLQTFQTDTWEDTDTAREGKLKIGFIRSRYLPSLLSPEVDARITDT